MRVNNVPGDVTELVHPAQTLLSPKRLLGVSTPVIIFSPFIVRVMTGLALGLLFLSAARGEEVEVPGVTAIVRKHFPEGSPGGLALLAVRDGTILHSKGYGLKNGITPITPKTQMGLASVSKQFAAMCAAILIEEGKLRLTDKVSRHLPEIELPKIGRELLIQDLLWHTSGLANFINAKEKASIEQYKQEHGLERLSNLTHAEWLTTMSLRRNPGTLWEYSNSGYVLLARIIEVVAGKPFHVFQQERIFDVLGMSDTTDSKRFNGSGNMTMSLEDYLKWDTALWNETLLNEKTSKTLFLSGKLDNGVPVGYAFGWFVTYEGNTLSEVSHGGSGSPKASSRNYVLRDINNRVTIVLFARENLKLNKAVRKRFAEEIRDYVVEEVAN